MTVLAVSRQLPYGAQRQAIVPDKRSRCLGSTQRKGGAVQPSIARQDLGQNLPNTIDTRRDRAMKSFEFHAQLASAGSRGALPCTP